MESTVPLVVCIGALLGIHGLIWGYIGFYIDDYRDDMKILRPQIHILRLRVEDPFLKSAWVSSERKLPGPSVHLSETRESLPKAIAPKVTNNCMGE